MSFSFIVIYLVISLVLTSIITNLSTGGVNLTHTCILMSSFFRLCSPPEWLVILKH